MGNTEASDKNVGAETADQLCDYIINIGGIRHHHGPPFRRSHHWYLHRQFSPCWWHDSTRKVSQNALLLQGISELSQQASSLILFLSSGKITQQGIWRGEDTFSSCRCFKSFKRYVFGTDTGSSQSVSNNRNNIFVSLTSYHVGWGVLRSARWRVEWCQRQVVCWRWMVLQISSDRLGQFNAFSGMLLVALPGRSMTGSTALSIRATRLLSMFSMSSSCWPGRRGGKATWLNTASSAVAMTAVALAVISGWGWQWGSSWGRKVPTSRCKQGTLPSLIRKRATTWTVPAVQIIG